MAKVTLIDGGRVGSCERGILLRCGCWSPRTGHSPQNTLSAENAITAFISNNQWKTGTLIHEPGLLLSLHGIRARFSFAVEPRRWDEATRESSPGGQRGSWGTLPGWGPQGAAARLGAQPGVTLPVIPSRMGKGSACSASRCAIYYLPSLLLIISRFSCVFFLSAIFFFHIISTRE